MNNASFFGASEGVLAHGRRLKRSDKKDSPHEGGCAVAYQAIKLKLYKATRFTSTLHQRLNVSINGVAEFAPKQESCDGRGEEEGSPSRG